MRSFVQVKPRASTSETPADDLSTIEMAQEEESEGNLSTLDLGVAVSLGYESDLPDDEPIEMPPADEVGNLEDAGEESDEPYRKCR